MILRVKIMCFFMDETGITLTGKMTVSRVVGKKLSEVAKFYGVSRHQIFTFHSGPIP